MREKRKIANNCERATFLIEKKQFGTISFSESLEQIIHLAGCSACRIFQKQSKLINLIIRNIFNAPVSKELKLDEQFKEELQESIDEELRRS